MDTEQSLRGEVEFWITTKNTYYRDQEECVLNTQLHIYKVSYDYAGVKHQVLKRDSHLIFPA